MTQHRRKTKVLDRDRFETDAQYRKYLGLHALFKELIKMKREGYVFLIDDSYIETTPFIDSEAEEIGFDISKEGGSVSRVIYFGACTSNEKDKQGRDKLWVETTQAKLLKQIKPIKLNGTNELRRRLKNATG